MGNEDFAYHKMVLTDYSCCQFYYSFDINNYFITDLKNKMMKKFISVVIILFVIILFSCGSTSSNDAKKDIATSSDQTSSATAAGNEASFSCILDGRKISRTGTDQNINAAFHLTGDDKGKIVFRLSNLDNAGEKFQFEVPGKVGATTTNNFIGYTNSDMAPYLDNPITVVITSINNSGISGTFSGTYILQKGWENTNSKQTIEVTDGKFDIPFSTSADWKKLYHAE